MAARSARVWPFVRDGLLPPLILLPLLPSAVAEAGTEERVLAATPSLRSVGLVGGGWTDADKSSTPTLGLPGVKRASPARGHKC